MARKRQTVDEWVTSVTGEVIDGKACTAIALLHLKGMGGATEEVTTKPLEGNVNAKELADHLIGRAEGFSQDLPGIQTFKLIAFYGSNQPHSPFHFTTSDGTVMSRSETMMSVHEPTPTGLLGQLMKHNETLMNQNNQLVSSTMHLSGSVLSMCFGKDGMIQQAIKDQLEAVSVVKDAMLDMQKERKELIIAEAKAAQDLQMRKALLDNIPLLTNRLTGHEVFDEKANRAKILETIALKFSPKDLEMLVSLGKISKEEALALSATFAAIVDEKKKEQEALRKVPTEEGESKAIVTTNGKGV